MADKKKKFFPKLQKKMKSFLTDESGKITKKDALGLSAGAVFLGGVDGVSAAVTNFEHTSGVNTSEVTITHGGGTCDVNHASGIVNGHYSSTPTATLNNDEITDITHSSHGSHGSHGSHCSCTRWV